MRHGLREAFWDTTCRLLRTVQRKFIPSATAVSMTFDFEDTLRRKETRISAWGTFVRLESCSLLVRLALLIKTELLISAHSTLIEGRIGQPG